MMRRSAFSVLIVFAVATINIAHAQIPARARTCCGFMDGKIFCYGGDMFSTKSEFKSNSVMNVLDLTNSSGKSAKELENMWQPVSYNMNNVDLTSRTDAQCIILEDRKHMLINGGFDPVRPGQLINLNIAYNVDNNQWDALEDYREPPYGRRQIYYGSAVTIPGRGVAFYGGHEEHSNASWSIPTTGNLSVLNFGKPPTSRFIGYSQIALFQNENTIQAWSWLKPLQDIENMATEFNTGQVSVYDAVNKQIIFMGGGYRRNTPPAMEYVPRPFSNLSAFNLDNNQWQQLALTGEMPEPKRVYTTATLLPSTNRHVLLFGGEFQDANVCPEYCFTLNLDTKTWKKHVIAAPSGTILQRSRHSAVLVNNDTLFIMWGRDTNNNGIGSILILNVSNPDNIVLSNKYVDPNASNAGEDAENNTATNDDGSSSKNEHSDGSAGISTGAKAGIVVACIVAVILGLAAVWFYIRNKKNKEKIKQIAAKQQQDQKEYLTDRQPNDVVPMEVDWDQIENRYTEVPPVYVPQDNINNPDRALDCRAFSSNNNTTLVNSEGGSVKPQHLVHPDGIELQNPHVNEEAHSSSHLLQQSNPAKPDAIIDVDPSKRP